jgi:hypothetical protein
VTAQPVLDFEDPKIRIESDLPHQKRLCLLRSDSSALETTDPMPIRIAPGEPCGSRAIETDIPIQQIN